MKYIFSAVAILLLAAGCRKDDPAEVSGEMPAEVLERLSFENYETVTTKKSYGYHEFYEVGKDGTRYNIWSSGNEGSAIINSKREPEGFPTYATPEGYEGCAACLVTQSAGALGSLLGKPIAAGSLFIGYFDKDKVTSNALKSTVLGVPIDRVPVSVSGWYKYTPGEKFTDKNKKVIADRVDEPNIYAVFWDNDGGKVNLYGDDALTSSRIVSKAQVADLPATDEWTRFEMSFEGGSPDPEILAQRGYSFTLVCSSSKGGDSFEGAIGSTLLVDEIQVTFAN